jgi:uncharacterized protein (TIGR03067 family)
MATIASAKADKTGVAIGPRSILFFIAVSGCIGIGQPWIPGPWRAGTRSVGADDRQDIQGIWQVVMIEDCGRRVPVKPGTQIVTFNGDAVRLLDQGTPVPPCGSFVIDSVRETIDLEDRTARTGHGTYRGLYKLTATQLALCMGHPGQARPSDFETSPRNMHTLLIMERM